MVRTLRIDNTCILFNVAYVLLKCSLKVAAIVLISSSNEISEAKTCDLEKVLVSLSVDHTSPCKYDDIKKKSTTLCNVGISFLVLNAISFLLILNFLWIPHKKIGVCVAVSTQRICMEIYLLSSILWNQHICYVLVAIYTCFTDCSDCSCCSCCSWIFRAYNTFLHRHT